MTAGPELYVANAAAVWAFTDAVTEPVPGVARVETARTTRFILRRPGADVLSLLADVPAERRVIIEDSFDSPTPDLPDTVTVKRMPVMIRPAGLPTSGHKPGIEVRRVSTVDDLVVAEQVIADGFPVEGTVKPGELLPAGVLGFAGWSVWLALHDGIPAASCFTYDDGASVGVYLLATLPPHRSAGLGRAIMSAAMDERPDRLGTLVATEAGAPLYRSMGFVDVSTAIWYFRTAL